ncbi:hypothetical protein ODJ79_43870 [Actinoplanes sp. KI2]|uniref:hypothetical protein n=1 Tax=Actinoplanes sp. KI2 TaxID=2983315 RepID=UPI0021D5B324|nr:hypothetical protein [Actinoplanes sp. KI2]MCU7730697.1 hypothetical protein [Actinoplanes sp. KI2]
MLGAGGLPYAGEERGEYLSSPTAFWLVKLMDLGIVVPAALATAIGLLRGATWASTPMFAIVGAYTLIGASVTGMAVTMNLNHDPDASPGSALLTLAFAALAVAVYRPLFRVADRAVAPTTVAEARVPTDARVPR